MIIIIIIIICIRISEFIIITIDYSIYYFSIEKIAFGKTTTAHKVNVIDVNDVR